MHTITDFLFDLTPLKGYTYGLIVISAVLYYTQGYLSYLYCYRPPYVRKVAIGVVCFIIRWIANFAIVFSVFILLIQLYNFSH